MACAAGSAALSSSTTTAAAAAAAAAAAGTAAAADAAAAAAAPDAASSASRLLLDPGKRPAPFGIRFCVDAFSSFVVWRIVPSAHCGRDPFRYRSPPHTAQGNSRIGGCGRPTFSTTASDDVNVSHQTC